MSQDQDPYDAGQERRDKITRYREDPDAALILARLKQGPQQRDLTSIFALNESLHLAARAV